MCFVSRCCETRFDSSCTNPFTQNLISGTACPAVPKVSVTDALSGTATGRLDSDNTYVSEYLLQYADQLSDLGDYYTRFLGGFTVGRQEPAYSACGCSDASNFTLNYLVPLHQCSDLASSELSYVIPGAFEWYNSSNCSSLVSEDTVTVPGSGGGSGVGDAVSTVTVTTLQTLNSSVRVDGSSVGALQGLSCSTIDASSLSGVNTTAQEGCREDGTSQRPVSAFYPVQTQRTSVTLWYNGKVSVDVLFLREKILQSYNNVCGFLTTAMAHVSCHTEYIS